MIVGFAVDVYTAAYILMIYVKFRQHLTGTLLSIATTETNPCYAFEFLCDFSIFLHLL